MDSSAWDRVALWDLFGGVADFARTWAKRGQVLRTGSKDMICRAGPGRLWMHRGCALPPSLSICPSLSFSLSLYLSLSLFLSLSPFFSLFVWRAALSYLSWCFHVLGGGQSGSTSSSSTRHDAGWLATEQGRSFGWNGSHDGSQPSGSSAVLFFSGWFRGFSISPTSQTFRGSDNGQQGVQVPK